MQLLLLLVLLVFAVPAQGLPVVLVQGLPVALVHGLPQVLAHKLLPLQTTATEPPVLLLRAPLVVVAAAEADRATLPSPVSAC
jgi:hypothetical protein